MSLFKGEKAVPNKFLALYLQRRNFLFHFLIVIPVKDVLDRKENPRFFDPFLWTALIFIFFVEEFTIRYSFLSEEPRLVDIELRQLSLFHFILLSAFLSHYLALTVLFYTGWHKLARIISTLQNLFPLLHRVVHRFPHHPIQRLRLVEKVMLCFFLLEKSCPSVLHDFCHIAFDLPDSCHIWTDFQKSGDFVFNWAG